MSGCAVLHVIAAAGASSVSGLHALVLLVMACVCVPCATRTLLAPTRGAWTRGSLVSAGMLAVHPLLGLLDTAHAGHAATSNSAVVAIAMTAGPAVALALACVGLLSERGSRPSPSTA